MDATRMVSSANSYAAGTVNGQAIAPSTGQRPSVRGTDPNGASSAFGTNGNDRPGRPELANVVSRSVDGDTLQVNRGSEEEKRRRREGRITEKDDSSRAEKMIAERRMAEERRRQAIKEQVAAEEAKKQIEKDRQNSASFAGKTVSDIERMYQQGIISRSVYEEQKAIKEEDNKRVTEGLSDFTKKSSRLNGMSSKAELDARAVAGAFGDSSNKGPVNAKERLAAMDRVTQTNTNRREAAIAEGKRTWEFQLQA